MEFLSSICCCFYLPPRVSSDGGGALNQPLKSNFIKTEVHITILVPYFPVNSKLSHTIFTVIDFLSLAVSLFGSPSVTSYDLRQWLEAWQVATELTIVEVEPVITELEFWPKRSGIFRTKRVTDSSEWVWCRRRSLSRSLIVMAIFSRPEKLK
uniref:Uncharacterized protein n=1 Tax=Quercus lobata TaxID=97700 RepID=A0A7N2M3T5_QUELO